MKSILQSIACLMVLILSSGTIMAQNVTELTPSKNNTLYESAEGDLCNGTGDYIFAGVTKNGDIRRALLQFDLSEIPEGSQIESAELKLVMNMTIAGTKNMTPHEVLTAWGEGSSDAIGQEGAGAEATPGDATWVHTLYPDQNWSSTGGDFNDTVISSADVDANGSYTWASTPEFVSLIQKWLESPEDNFGLILIGDESETTTAKRFSSRHNPNEGDRPILRIEYTAETTSTDIFAERPDRIELHQNYPNPFNPTTTISFSLPEASFAEIAVYDMLGRKLQSVLNERVQAGKHSVAFDASTLSSGVYMYILQTENQQLTRRFTVLK
ncbi:DNRLRE domain-containing protein [Rhodohalobacter sp. 8-1]|uniref:DNRLRE domain-containing protein n=1 Tax=Rhodohalobacter sp. 8-1 TaxID=3131972 RepID=UPI0030ED52A8